MAEIRLNVDNQLALTSKQKTRYFFIISFKGFISSKAAEQQPTAFLSSKLITRDLSRPCTASKDHLYSEQSQLRFSVLVRSLYMPKEVII